MNDIQQKHAFFVGAIAILLDRLDAVRPLSPKTLMTQLGGCWLNLPFPENYLATNE
ncbi:MAG: hypothetical protein ACU83N_12975 [Gammaproteobacteria bacterium]